MNTLPTSSSSLPPVPASCVDFALTLLGPSAAMSQLWSQVRRLAPHVRTLLLTGKADSGQEAVARLLLELSPNSGRPFLVLTETEAEQRLAPGGLPHDVFVFIPAVERLSSAAQINLLRLLASRRLGGVSLVAATSEELRPLVSLGRFSAELAEVLGAIRIAVPSLAERKEDIPMLLNQSIAAACRNLNRTAPEISDALLRSAMQYAWPGNLGELCQAVADLLGDGNSAHLDHADLQRALDKQRTPKPKATSVRMIKLDAVVQEHISGVLRACCGNKQRASEVLGISRSTLYRMLDSSATESSYSLAS